MIVSARNGILSRLLSLLLLSALFASYCHSQGFVPCDIPNILENRVSIAECSSRDEISKIHVTSLLNAAGVDVLETTSVIARFYVLAKDRALALRVLSADPDLRPFLTLVGADSKVGNPRPRPYRVLEMEADELLPDRLRKLGNVIRSGVKKIESVGTIEVIAFRKRSYMSSVEKRATAFDCRVGYTPEGGGSLRWLVFQVLENWEIVGTRHGLGRVIQTRTSPDRILKPKFSRWELFLPNKHAASLVPSQPCRVEFCREHIDESLLRKTPKFALRDLCLVSWYDDVGWAARLEHRPIRTGQD